MTDTTDKKIKATHVIIALLVLVSIVQTYALIQQGKRQAVLEKQQQRSAKTVDAAPIQAFPFLARKTAAIPQTSPSYDGFWDSDPFEQFDAMSRRMSNIMRQAFSMAGPMMNQAMTGLSATSSVDFMPAVDFQETENAYIVRSDLPGLEKDKIHITVESNILTLQGMRESTSESRDQKQGFYSHERSYGSFARSLPLPGPVDENNIRADYKNGVLTITLPKAVPAKAAQKVAVQ